MTNTLTIAGALGVAGILYLYFETPMPRYRNRSISPSMQYGYRQGLPVGVLVGLTTAVAIQALL